MLALTLRTPAHRRWFALAGLSAALIAVAVLYLLNPLQELGWLRCPVQLTTGLYCPGCGSLRAVHALLHGEFIAALGFNLLAVLALPVLLVSGMLFLLRALQGRRLVVSISPWFAWTVFAVIILFTILRNLPVEFLLWLRP